MLDKTKGKVTAHVHVAPPTSPKRILWFSLDYTCTVRTWDCSSARALFVFHSRSRFLGEVMELLKRGKPRKTRVYPYRGGNLHKYVYVVVWRG